MEPNQPGGNGVVITLANIYDQLVKLTGEVSALSGKLDRAVNDLGHAREDVADHETRLRSVESRVWTIPTAPTVLAVLALVLPFLGVH